jgi:hypothetical protein
MATATKETIYIEADDEITTVIEKIITAKNKIIAVVLPKRATVFQSVVNMKLLKKAADETKRKVVLISSEPGIEAIASVAGMYIAQSLTSKPFIPKRSSKTAAVTTVTLNDEEVAAPPQKVTLEERENLESTPISAEDDAAIEIDNTEDTEVTEAVETIADVNTEKKKKFKIPDFSSFRLRLGLGITALVLLIVGWFFGFIVMPKATITVNADTSNSATTLDFTVDTAATELSEEAGTLPAKLAEVSKEDKATSPATGEKNMGEKAKGIITLTNCASGGAKTIPSGTAFSAGSYTFVTTEEVDLGPAVIIGNCRSADFPNLTTPGAIEDVAVVATSAGEAYNLAARAYQSSVNGVSAYGSDMTGGSTKIVKIVSADDIQKAKDQLKGAATADATKELQSKLQEQNLQALPETLTTSEAAVKVSTAVDAEATEVTVTQTVTYRMLGVQNEQLATLLNAKIKAAFEDNAQKNIRSNGLDKATYSLKQKVSDTKQVISLQTIAVLGATFDTDTIKKDVVGKKRGEIEKMLETRDGVKSVSVEYSPFWITTTPKSVNKISIVVNEVSE